MSRTICFATFLLAEFWCCASTLKAEAPAPTGVQVRVSGESDGPTVVVVAGGRPEQRFPLHALRQIRGWPLIRGRLITLSVESPRPSGGLEKWIASQRPDWVVELREDFYHPRPGLRTRGGRVIPDKEAAASGVAGAVVKSVNATLPDARNRFRVRAMDEREDSMALAIGRSPTVAGLLLVTSARRNTTPTREFRVAVRIRQQRLMVHRLLRELKMISAKVAPDRYLPARTTGRKRAEAPLFVGIYDGEGSGRPMPFCTDLMNGLNYVQSHPIHPDEIRHGGLPQFDVVVFPGGMASHQFDALRPAGRDAVRTFVRNGGGYVGICAGAYMAASRPYQWGLGLLDARIVDHEHWARGIGTVKIELSDAGREIFETRSGKIDYHYGNGPIFAPGQSSAIEDYEVLAWFRTGIGRNGADPQVMVDTPAIVTGQFGKGRVLASSGHSEWSSGIEAYLLRYIEWAGRRKRSTPPTSAAPRR